MSTNASIDDATAERRRWRRYHFAAPVRVTIEKPRHTTPMDTHACQMNDGGIAINTNAELSIGAQAKIEFALLSFDFPLTLRGVVRNRAGNQYGVEFLVTSAAEQEHLILFGEILRRKAGCFDA
jgi:hypothetical protein